MAAVSVLVACALLLAVGSRSDVVRRSAVKAPVNLNRIERPEQLAPALTLYELPAERRWAEQKLFEFISGNRPLTHTGQFSQVRFRAAALGAVPAQGRLAGQFRERTEGQTDAAKGRMSLPVAAARQVQPPSRAKGAFPAMAGVTTRGRRLFGHFFTSWPFGG